MDQTEKAYQKQDNVFVGAKKSAARTALRSAGSVLNEHIFGGILLIVVLHFKS